jgi:hypothetical protein
VVQCAQQLNICVVTKHRTISRFLVCHILVQKSKEYLGGAHENANAINPSDICSTINHTIKWLGKTEWDRFEVSLTYITFTHTSAIYSIISSLLFTFYCHCTDTLRCVMLFLSCNHFVNAYFVNVM